MVWENEDGQLESAEGEERWSAVSDWRFADLVDFEQLVMRKREGRASWEDEELPGVGRILMSGLSEAEKRREVFWLWLGRERERAGAGRSLERGLRWGAVILCLLGFLAGSGVMRGLLRSDPRAFHLWILLAVAVVLPVVLWVLSLLGALFWRRGGRSSLVAEFLEMLALRFGGKEAERTWRLLQQRESAQVAAWRVARLIQLASVALGVGLLVGFLGLLWFYRTFFYWESTLESFSGPQLEFMAELLASPWRWVVGPGDFGPLVRVSQGVNEEVAAATQWARFFTLAMLVWVVVPRVLLWAWCGWRERGALARLTFQDPDHRELWRGLTRVKTSTQAPQGPADGAILLDVGGTGVDGAHLRPFLLRELRVHPVATHQVAVIDPEAEREALRALGGQGGAVVLLVEGWNLSPPQMTRLHERLREVCGEERPFWYVVSGIVEGGCAVGPATGEFEQWRRFVDDLRDLRAEVVPYGAA